MVEGLLLLGDISEPKHLDFNILIYFKLVDGHIH